MAQLKSAAEKKASPLLALIFFVLAAVGAALYVLISKSKALPHLFKE